MGGGLRGALEVECVGFGVWGLGFGAYGFSG